MIDLIAGFWYFIYRKSQRDNKVSECLEEDGGNEGNRKKDILKPEAVLEDLDDSDSIRNPFTDSSSGEWYVGFFKK